MLKMSILMYDPILHNDTGVNSKVPLAYFPPEGGGRGSFESGLRKCLCMPMVENARSRPMDAKEKEGLGAGPPSKRAEL
jgi:hypothetical protein